MFKDYSVKILHRLSPGLLWRSLTNKTNKQLAGKYFILSFDCDTDEDIATATGVHEKLEALGIRPVYAVPGELLKRGATVYREFHKAGSEFINHGGRSHTYYDEKLQRYASCFFYHQQPRELIREDIILGHKTLEDVLGISPIGWRTPHFGSFQSKTQLNYLYSILSTLGYKFSSSTIPSFGYKYGSYYYDKSNIVEFPVTGSFTEPLNIIDSWGYFQAPDRTRHAGDYMREIELLVSYIADKNVLLNIYADPSHIHDKREFFEAMGLIASVATNTCYQSLLGKFYEQNASIVQR